MSFLQELLASICGVIINNDARDKAGEYQVYPKVDITLKDVTTGEILWTEKDIKGPDSYWVSDKAAWSVEAEEEGIQ